MTDALAARVDSELTRLAGDMGSVGVALSGGGDSIALMRLTKLWARGRRVLAATVDHGLRAESAAEADFAADAADDLDIPHEVLNWNRDRQSGNLMAQARDARLRLLGEWAAQRKLDAVLLGHTMDDQAETLLMRLGRGSGVDGLSGMVASRKAFGTVWLRPLLTTSRAALRDWLQTRDVGWIDDPSNQNTDFERIRMRKALEMLDISASSLGQTAANMAMARSALQEFAARATEDAVAEGGRLAMPLSGFSRSPEEIRRRIVVAGLRWMTGADYPARREKIMHALTAIGAGGRTTLEGVIIERRSSRIQMIREPAAAERAGPALPDEGGQTIWDNRWRVRGVAEGQQVRALGHVPLAGLGWRQSGLTRDEAASTPAVWQGTELVAAPLLKPSDRVTAVPLRGPGHFRALLFSH